MEQDIIEVRPDVQIFYRDIGPGESGANIPLACWLESFDPLAREGKISEGTSEGEPGPGAGTRAGRALCGVRT